MRTYAIWKDHKVIGYIQLTEEQKEVLNNTTGIGLYFGVDNVTAPESYIADFTSIVARLKAGETFEDISADVLEKTGEDVDDWPFECYRNDVYEDGDLYDFLEYVGAEICYRADDYVLIKTKVGDIYKFPSKDIPNRFDDTNGDETIISFDKDKMSSRIFVRTLCEGQPHQVVKIDGQLRVLYNADTNGGYEKIFECHQVGSEYYIGNPINDKHELFYKGHRVCYHYCNDKNGTYRLDVGKGQLIDKEGVPYYIGVTYCNDTNEFFFRFHYGDRDWFKPPHNQFGEEEREEFKTFLLQLIKDEEETKNER